MINNIRFFFRQKIARWRWVDTFKLTFLFYMNDFLIIPGSEAGSRPEQSSDPSQASALHLARLHQAQEIFSKVHFT